MNENVIFQAYISFVFYFAEIINAIIQHSPDATSILKRKVLSCSTLYTYLHQNSVRVYSPVTKKSLIESILKFWKDRANNIDKHESSQQQHCILQQQCEYLDEYDDIQESESDSVSEKREWSVVNSNINNEIQRETINFPINVMARMFSEWFYKMFNAENGLTSDHFWPDSSLRVHIKSGDNVDVQETLSNAGDVVDLLERTKCSHGLYFNPNISHGGVQGRIDVHGLALIVACGTLHKDNLCVGVFQQMFALARDPQADNNWKVKSIELKLNSQSVNNIPSILDSDYRNNILALPVRDDLV